MELERGVDLDVRIPTLGRMFAREMGEQILSSFASAMALSASSLGCALRSATHWDPGHFPAARSVLRPALAPGAFIAHSFAC